VAEALRALGYSVWSDAELPAHRNYADVIEERLRASKAVVVIWSAEAAKSQWVRPGGRRGPQSYLHSGRPGGQDRPVGL
jgi:hypothetical protein